jgi:hypothetical protein
MIINLLHHIENVKILEYYLCLCVTGRDSTKTL